MDSRFSPSQTQQKLATAMGRRPTEIYVIYSKEQNSVLHDPMTNLPVNAIHPKMLEKTAQEFKGTIITLAEAVKLLINHPNTNH